ncbi:MAG: hypothetical protein U0900_01450 [Myxococcota bacterium]
MGRRRRAPTPPAAIGPAVCGGTGAGRRAATAALGAGMVAVLALACVPTRGGWDVDGLRRARPAIAALPGERIGDLVPFPALALDAEEASERVELVACRFPAPSTLRVATLGAGWWEEAGGPALSALASALEPEGLALRRVADAETEAVGIRIEAFHGEGPELPEGLGDTLVECDVAPRPADAGPRGRILRAEVRMRRSGRDAAGRLRSASEAEWAGALLHELGHALGYAGHAATGDSIFVRDEFELRNVGRRVLRGEPLEDATLRALLALEPGEWLGARRLEERDADWVRAVRALDRRWRDAGGRRVEVVASVGDREARWSVRYADGRRLGLRFPGWPDRLREGRELLVFPDRETLAALRASLQDGEAESGISP